MKVITFFNNKGGVGKTTLICNIASIFAEKFDCRVGLIDCDPQCNSTQLVLGEKRASELYLGDTSKIETMLDVTRPLEDGEPAINTNVGLLSKNENRFEIDVLPGHPRLSIIEDILSQAWGASTAGTAEGLRKTNWLCSLLDKISPNYDYLFIDVGPSLGSINRSVLLASDFFVAPMGADIFSIVGVRNISDWLSKWIELYEIGIANAKKLHPDKLEKYNIRTNVRIRSGFCGYTSQQYITKSKEGERIPTQAYETILKRVPEEINHSLSKYFAKKLTVETASLGDIPNMFSLIPLAQSVHSPVHALESGDGIRGSQYSQVAKYSKRLVEVATSLRRNVSAEEAL